MFNRESRPIIPELVVESADSVVESADSEADFAADPIKIGLWVRALKDFTSIKCIDCSQHPLRRNHQVRSGRCMFHGL